MKNIEQIIKKGFGKRKSLMLIGIIPGSVMGVVFLIEGMRLGASLGVFLISFGGFLILCSVVLSLVMLAERKNLRRVLMAIHKKNGVARIYIVRVRPYVVAPTGAALDGVMSDFFHIFIGLETGESIQFSLDLEALVDLFCSLMAIFPKAKYSYPVSHEEKMSREILENGIILDRGNWVEEKIAYKETIQSGINRVKAG